MLECLEGHIDVWHKREQYEPDPRISQLLRDIWGIRPEIMREINAPLHQGQAIACAWESLASTHCDTNTKGAYQELARQTDLLFEMCRSLLGIKVMFVQEHEPYDMAADQARHLRLDRTIRIAHGLGGDHPALTPEQYDRFRAVHDIFGHAGIGGGFDRHGEYQAWMVHMTMFSGVGAWAMSSEYRGVNSSLWAGRAAGTGKAALLPLRLFQYGRMRI